jgi:hypothetical protein
LKTKTIGYFPTIEGKPARMHDMGQICYAADSFPVKLEPSRRTVTRQIAKSLAFRRSLGWTDTTNRYGIARVAA